MAKPGKISVLRLSLADLLHERILAICMILALAAIISPLIIVLGLKDGVINNMRADLIEDPVNREIRPQQTQDLAPEWFDTMAAREDVAFIVPGILRGASIVRTANKATRRSKIIDLLPTAEGDPLLTENGARTPAAGEVAISRPLADELDLGEGDTIVLEVTRTQNNRPEVQTLEMQISGVLGIRGDALERIYAPLQLVLDVENYKEGFAVPERGWPGRKPEPTPLYDAALILVPARLTALQKAEMTVATGFSRLTPFTAGEFEELYGFPPPDYASEMYLLETINSAVNAANLNQLANKLRGRGALILPVVRPLELDLGDETLSIVGYTMSDRQAESYGLLAPPWSNISADATFLSHAQILMPSAASGPQRLIAPPPGPAAGPAPAPATDTPEDPPADEPPATAEDIAPAALSEEEQPASASAGPADGAAPEEAEAGDGPPAGETGAAEPAADPEASPETGETADPEPAPEGGPAPGADAGSEGPASPGGASALPAPGDAAEPSEAVAVPSEAAAADAPVSAEPAADPTSPGAPATADPAMEPAVPDEAPQAAGAGDAAGTPAAGPEQSPEPETPASAPEPARPAATLYETPASFQATPVAARREGTTFPLAAVGEAPGPRALVPLHLAATLRAIQERSAQYSDTEQTFLMDRSGFRAFRLYAASIDDVPGLVDEINAQGILSDGKVGEIIGLQRFSRGLDRVFLLVASVGGIGGMASLIASLYAAVERKKQEISVMRLLGLSPAQVSSFPVYQGVLLAVGALSFSWLAYKGVGAAVNAALAREIDGQAVYLDPLVFGAVVAIVLAIAMLSALIAAYRATRIEPADALRVE